MRKAIAGIALLLLTAPLFAHADVIRNTFTAAEDTAITTYLYAKLAAAPELAKANIDITTTAGNVVLNGVVGNQDEAETLIHLVEVTKGVNHVDATNLIIGKENKTLIINEAETSAPRIIIGRSSRVGAEYPADSYMPPVSQPQPIRLSTTIHRPSVTLKRPPSSTKMIAQAKIRLPHHKQLAAHHSHSSLKHHVYHASKHPKKLAQKTTNRVLAQHHAHRKIALKHKPLSKIAGKKTKLPRMAYNNKNSYHRLPS